MDKVARLPRRAVVTSNKLLCPSGTFKLSFQVSDGEPRWQDVETIASRFVAKDAQNLFTELTRLKSDRASS